jgi:hypothetical protein
VNAEVEIDELKQRVRALECIFGSTQSKGTPALGSSVAIQVKAIQVQVARHARLSLSNMLGKSHDEHFVRPRHLAIWLARQLTGASTSHLGRLFHRDHVSILHALKATGARIDTEPRFAAEAEHLLSLFTHNRTTKEIYERSNL